MKTAIDEAGKPGRRKAVRTDITELKLLEIELQNKIRLQRLLANLSAHITNLPSSQVPAAIRKAQQFILEALNLDRSTYWEFTDNCQKIELKHYAGKSNSSLLPEITNARELLPWCCSKVMAGEGFWFSRIEDLPPEAVRDAATFRALGQKSNVTIPLVADGHVFGAIAFATFKNERPWTEDELTDLRLIAQIIGNVTGRQLAENRSRQLREETARSARSAMLGELSAALAHELSQPLSAILSNAQAGQRFLESGVSDPVELSSILEDIERDSKRAGNVVHSLRTMLGRKPLERERCCILSTLNEVAEFMHAELVGQKIRLVVLVGSDLPDVQAVHVELQQILMNLLLNAMQAMKATPPDSRTIEITAYYEDGSIMVSVRDHGSGIPEDRLGKIFDAFYTTKAAGLGMGLAICRRFVESYGGRIEACNHDEGGAIFSFLLPAASENKTKE